MPEEMNKQSCDDTAKNGQATPLTDPAAKAPSQSAQADAQKTKDAQPGVAQSGAEKPQDDEKPKEPQEHTKRKKEKFDYHHMEGWQKVRLFGSLAVIIAVFGIFLAVTCGMLATDKHNENEYWNYYLTENEDVANAAQPHEANATHIHVAVYLEQLRKIDIRNSQFEVVLSVGYRWNGDPTIDCSDPDAIHFYKGNIDTIRTLEDSRNASGIDNYQQVRYDVVINKEFWTPRFPLESHQLRIYMEPSDNVNKVVLDADTDNSYVNASLGISGFDLTRYAVSQTVIGYNKTLGNPLYDSYNGEPVYKTEIMTQFEINRQDFGLYFRCFVALYGTTAWILLCMYICTFRRVDPLGMIGAAFFGAVSNIMVGANLVPDALAFGLLEFTNLFGVALIIAGTAVVISINTIRNEWKDMPFAGFYGRIMLAVFIAIAVIGNLALPLSAWMV